MFRVLLLCLLTGLLTGCSSRQAVQASTVRHQASKGDRLNTSELPLLNGGSVSLFQQQRRGTLLVFWATWCEPCRKEVPILRKFQAGEARHGIVVLGVNEGDEARRIRAFLQDYSVPYRIALDSNQQFMASLGLEHIPSMVLVDRRGVVRYVGDHLPADPTQLEEALRQ